MVDTDVLSFWLKNDTRGASYSTVLADGTLVISFQSVGELLRWPAQLGWGIARRASLEQFLHLKRWIGIS